MRPRIDPWYGLLTLVAVAGISWLSSRADLGTTASEPLVQVASNLMHAPLFAALTFCLVRSLSPAQELTWAACGAVFLAAGVFAAVDEWHQSFVPGRQPSLLDFLMDMAGVSAVLLIARLRSMGEGHP